jgi:acyl transferase domain-containing protein
MTMLSNRLSYSFDFRGPSISVDTACSSSLVAFHYACQDLWQGRTTMALAGGVNITLMPNFPVLMSKGGFLAPDGRSKSFDARADGYGRGEGAGIIVLKRLSDAQAAGDRIYALVQGTGVNQDGRTNGITVPNGDAQQALIRQVYAEAGVDPALTVYTEAHGTGTPGLFSSVSMIGGIAQSESRRGMRQGKKCLSLREDM